MTIYQLYRIQHLSLCANEAWDFFSSPYHLNDITPAFFNVEIMSIVPKKIYPGLMISYRMRAGVGISMAWLSEISHCQEPKRFVYEQRIGPFKFWSHEVRITETASGITMEDIVFYTMPFAWLGALLHYLLIENKLKQIFTTRHDWLQAKWGITAKD